MFEDAYGDSSSEIVSRRVVCKVSSAYRCATLSNIGFLDCLVGEEITGSVTLGAFSVGTIVPGAFMATWPET